MREFLLTTLKLLIITAITAFSCGMAYGWDVGARVMGGFSLIIVVAQCWAHRSDILQIIQGAK